MSRDSFLKFITILPDNGALLYVLHRAAFVRDEDKNDRSVGYFKSNTLLRTYRVERKIYLWLS